jgi:signal transduction histidine kinase/ActR/RegA family two-component response regulator/HAMP domain-containing protein
MAGDGREGTPAAASAPAARTVRLGTVIIYPLLALLLLAALGAGLIASLDSRSAVTAVAARLRTEITARLREQIRAFMARPLEILDVDAAAIRQDRLPAGDQAALQARFLEQVLLSPTVTSIYFANSGGGLADAGREGPGGPLYVIGTDGFTSGVFRKWSVTPDGTRVDLLQTMADFDARVRTWYGTAVARGGPVWTMHALFTGQDMAITASRPVYDRDGRLVGVLGADLFLSQVRAFLRGVPVGRTGVSFVMESGGFVIASSLTGPAGATGAEGSAQREDARHSDTPLIRAAAAALEKRLGSLDAPRAPVSLDFPLDGGLQHLEAEAFHDDAGLDWTLVTIIPDSDYMGPVNAGTAVSIALMLAALLAGALALELSLRRWVLKPVAQLDAAARLIAAGRPSPAPVGGRRITEIGGLARSFEAMTVQLHTTVRELTAEVEEHSRTSRELGELQARQEFILSATQTGMDIIGADYQVRYVDAETRRRYGDYSGQTCYRYFMGRDLPCADCGLIHAIGSGQVTVTEKILPKEGNRPVLVTSFPYRDEKGEKLVAEVSVDLRERRRLESERLEMERRLLHGQKLESLGVLAGGIAHDFNNLLMAIGGNIELALDDLPGHDEVRRSLQDARAACGTAADLTRLMLAYAGKGRIVFEPLDLAVLVRENAAMLQAAAARTARLVLRGPHHLPLVEADRAQVQQVILNLVANASDALAGAEDEISITTGETVADAAELSRSRLDEKPSPGPFVVLEVSDTGRGMSAATLERLFDPFFSTKGAGRGLGLSAVIGIVRSHRGAIMVTSAEGSGTTVRILFPVAAAAAAAEESAAPAPEAAPRAARGTILVADDESSLRSLCAAYLRRLGFEVVTAQDGREAVDLFRQRQGEIRIALLDLSMPRLDGCGAAAEILQLSPGTPVILCTGFGEAAAARCSTVKLAGFLEKPFGLQQLREALAAALDER